MINMKADDIVMIVFQFHCGLTTDVLNQCKEIITDFQFHCGLTRVFNFFTVSEKTIRLSIPLWININNLSHIIKKMQFTFNSIVD